MGLGQALKTMVRYFSIGLALAYLRKNRRQFWGELVRFYVCSGQVLTSVHIIVMISSVWFLSCAMIFQICVWWSNVQWLRLDEILEVLSNLNDAIKGRTHRPRLAPSESWCIVESLQESTQRKRKRCAGSPSAEDRDLTCFPCLVFLC